MQINRVRLQNFRQHENTEIEFGPGLTGIIGPNGAGKTTLLEAIAWAMYGMPAARGSRETLRRRGAPPKARVVVEVDFTLGAHGYRVVRSLNSAELYQDGDVSAVANSIGAVTERVTRLLGMTRDQFFNTYFTGQKQLAVMAAMSAPERAQFLSQVLGYERLRIAQERLKERRSALRARLEGLRAGLPDGSELEAARKQADERLAAARAAETAAGAASGAAEQQLATIRPQWEAAPAAAGDGRGARGRAQARRAEGDGGHGAGRAAGAGSRRRRLRPAKNSRRYTAASRRCRRCAARHRRWSARPKPTPRGRATRPSWTKCGPIWPRSRSASPGCHRSSSWTTF